MPQTDRLLHIKFDGKDYNLAPQDLTVSALRQMKQWFGAPYGRYLPFIQMVMEGDCDAVACSIWLVRKKAGERNVPEPRFIDIPVSEFFVGINEDEPDEEEAPTAGPDEQTPDSTLTSGTSGPSTSGS